MARLNPPAPTVIPPQLKLIVESECEGQINQTVLGYNGALVPTYPTLSSLSAFVNAWVTVNETQYAACLSPKSSIIKYTCAEVGQGTCPTFVDILVTPVPGTAGTNNLPLEMSAILNILTGLKGQHGRGRIMMPAVPDSFTTPATDPNKLNNTGLTAYATLLGSLLIPVVTSEGSWPLAVQTRPVAPAVLVTRAVNALNSNVNPVLGTMRRRRPGRGI